MTTVVLAVIMTVFGCVLNHGWAFLQGSRPNASVYFFGSNGPQDTGKPDKPGENGGTDTLTGTISKDGRAFSTDHGQKWSIANRDSVKGYEGQRVTMEARMSPDKSKNEIHVMSVKMTGKKSAGSANSEKQK
jgi:hypothetical protein